MEAAQRISRDKLRSKIGRSIEVLVDEVRSDGMAVARSKGDAPEIDGHVFVRGAHGLSAGEITTVKVARTDAYDLWAEPAGRRNAPPRLAPRGRVHRVISRV
jgi:ribosomal protein S12 methylthiotransferase